MIISLLADWAATKFQLICPAKLSKNNRFFGVNIVLLLAAQNHAMSAEDKIWLEGCLR